MLSYLLVLRSEETGVVINIFLDPNETEVVLDPQDGLEESQNYVYIVTAISNIGVVTSYQDINGNVFCEIYIKFVYCTVNDICVCLLFSYL